MVKTRPADLICNPTRQSPRQEYDTKRPIRSQSLLAAARSWRCPRPPRLPHPPLRRIFAFSPLNLLRVILRRPAPGSKPGRDGELFPSLPASVCLLACSLGGVPREGSSNVGSRVGRVRRTGRARRGTRARSDKNHQLEDSHSGLFRGYFLFWLQSSSEDLPSGRGGWLVVLLFLAGGTPTLPGPSHRHRQMWNAQSNQLNSTQPSPAGLVVLGTGRDRTR